MLKWNQMQFWMNKTFGIVIDVSLYVSANYLADVPLDIQSQKFAVAAALGKTKRFQWVSTIE